MLLTLQATANVDLSSGLFIGITDGPNSVVESVQLTVTSSLTADAVFKIRDTLAAGHWTGNLQILLCKNAACTSQYPGSPVALPYDVTVQARAQALSIKADQPVVRAEAGDAVDLPIYGEIVNYGLTVKVEDQNGNFGSGHTLWQRTAGKLTFGPNANSPITKTFATPGTYSGTLLLHVYDAQQRETKDSPISVPYAILIYANSNLLALPSGTGLPDWQPKQGNAAHTGYVPVSLDASTFSKRWTWNAPGGTPTLNDIAISSGKIVLNSGFLNCTLLALNESSGTQAWNHVCGPDTYAAPYISAGWLYTLSQSAVVKAHDLSNGVVMSSLSNSSGWGGDWIVGEGNDIYVPAGGMGVARIDPLPPILLSGSASVPYAHSGEPAIDADLLYFYCSERRALFTLNRHTATPDYTIGDAGPTAAGGEGDVSPILGASNSVVVPSNYEPRSRNGFLSRFDTAARVRSWLVPGRYNRKPAVSGGHIYAMQDDLDVLEVRNEATGELEWAWHPPFYETPSNSGNIIVTNNLLFASYATNTYAIDLATRKLVWSYPKSGQLALSPSKVLYILNGSRIDAFNLFN